MINLKTLKPARKQSDLEKEIERLLAELAEKHPTDEEYAQMVDQLVKLYPLKKVDTDSKKRVSSDALVNLAANIIGVLLITNHEYTHALNSKALNLFVGKKVAN